MKNPWTGRRAATPLLWPASLLVALALWAQLADGGGVAGLLGAAASLAAVTLGIAWLSRTRDARRLRAALDAYAQREIDKLRLEEPS